VVGTGVFRSFTLGAVEQETQLSDLDTMIASNDVVLFISSTCPFCRMAIDMLTQEGIEHRVIEVDPSIRSELHKRTGKTSVPSTWIKGQYVGGCNDGPEDWMGVVPMLKSGKFKELLES
jgi:glutaredoxin 3